MNITDKILIIQDLQCEYAIWLAEYNTALSLNMCPETWIMTNMLISNLLETVYRYVPFDATVTNADIVNLTVVEPITTETIDITIDYGITNIATYSGSDDINTIVNTLCDEINSTTITHGYYCIIQNNSLYLYTYNVTATYADSPVLTYTETIPRDAQLSMSTTDIDSDSLDVILDTFNCITYAELGTMVCKLRELLNDCNCN